MTRIIHPNLQQLGVLMHLQQKKKYIYVTGKDRATSKANNQPSCEYFSVRMRIILIMCFLYILSYGESKSNQNIIRVVKYAMYDEQLQTLHI